MSREWKPGDVAIATARRVPNVRVFRLNEGTWVSAEPAGATRVHHDEHVTDVRPLVVLNPSEFIAENLVPLLKATAEKGTEGLYARRSAVRFIADQIEAQIRPPKPAEPGKYGAVIAGDGREWFRYTTSERKGRDWCRPGTESGTEYAIGTPGMYEWLDRVAARLEALGAK